MASTDHYSSLKWALTKRQFILDSMSVESMFSLISVTPTYNLSLSSLGQIVPVLNTFEPNMKTRPEIFNIEQQGSPCPSLIPPNSSGEASLNLSDSPPRDSRSLLTLREVCEILIDSNQLILCRPPPKKISLKQLMDSERHYYSTKEAKKKHKKEDEGVRRTEEGGRKEEGRRPEEAGGRKEEGVRREEGGGKKEKGVEERREEGRRGEEGGEEEGSRELLFEEIEQSVEDEKTVYDLLKETFMATTNEQTRLHVSRIKFIFYKGKYSVLVRFGDSDTAAFLYFNFTMSNNFRTRKIFGANFNVYMVSENKIKAKKQDWVAVVIRGLNLQIEREHIINRIREKVGVVPKWVEEIVMIKGWKYALVGVGEVEEAERICKHFMNSVDLRNKIKANIHPHSSKRRKIKTKNFKHFLFLEDKYLKPFNFPPIPPKKTEISDIKEQLKYKVLDFKTKKSRNPNISISIDNIINAFSNQNLIEEEKNNIKLEEAEPPTKNEEEIPKNEVVTANFLTSEETTQLLELENKQEININPLPQPVPKDNIETEKIETEEKERLEKPSSKDPKRRSQKIFKNSSEKNLKRNVSSSSSDSKRKKAYEKHEKTDRNKSRPSESELELKKYSKTKNYRFPYSKEKDQSSSPIGNYSYSNRFHQKGYKSRHSKNFYAIEKSKSRSRSRNYHNERERNTERKTHYYEKAEKNSSSPRSNSKFNRNSSSHSIEKISFRKFEVDSKEKYRKKYFNDTVFKKKGREYEGSPQKQNIMLRIKRERENNNQNKRKENFRFYKNKNNSELSEGENEKRQNKIKRERTRSKSRQKKDDS